MNWRIIINTGRIGYNHPHGSISSSSIQDKCQAKQHNDADLKEEKPD
jgi:hypothetical protein